MVEVEVEVEVLEFLLLGFSWIGVNSRFRQWLWSSWIFGHQVIIEVSSGTRMISPDSRKTEILSAASCDVTYCLAAPHPCCILKLFWCGESCGDFILALTWLKKDSKMSLFDLELFQFGLISSDVLIAGAILGSIWIMLFFLALWDYPGWPEISSRARIRCSLFIGTCHFWVLAWSLSYLFV